MVCVTGAKVLELGDPVAEVRVGSVGSSVCDSCGLLDTVFVERSVEKQDLCEGCGATSVRSVACSKCGAVGTARWESYQGCSRCGGKGGGTSRALRSVGALCLVTSLALSTCVSAVNTITNPVLHIVEEPGAVDQLAESAPSDAYYDALDASLRKRHPKADPLLLDHLVSLEAFLDKSILAGFSFGVDKASVAVQEDKLLSHYVSRSGVRADGQAVQGVRDFAPLHEKLHIQQFLGCTTG